MGRAEAQRRQRSNQNCITKTNVFIKIRFSFFPLLTTMDRAVQADDELRCWAERAKRQVDVQQRRQSLSGGAAKAPSHSIAATTTVTTIITITNNNAVTAFTLYIIYFNRLRERLVAPPQLGNENAAAALPLSVLPLPSPSVRMRNTQIEFLDNPSPALFINCYNR